MANVFKSNRIAAWHYAIVKAKTEGDSGRKRAGAYEQQALMQLIGTRVMLRHVLDSDPEEKGLMKRLKGIVRGRNKLATAVGLLETLEDDILDTLPKSQIESLDRQKGGMEFCVQVHGPTKANNNNGRYFSEDEIHTIGYALREQCKFCTLDKQERPQCRYKRVLDILPIEEDGSQNDGSCGYYGAW